MEESAKEVGIVDPRKVGKRGREQVWSKGKKGRVESGEGKETG